MLSPSQIAEGVALAETEGSGFTVTVTVSVPVQPDPSVPVTVYVVVDIGVSVTFAPDNDPGIQLYVAAPNPSSVTVSPAQIVEGVATAVTAGDTSTVMVTTSVAVHPFPSVPITVYVVLLAGMTETGLPEIAPGFHSYVAAPLPVSSTGEPEQTVVKSADALTVGTGRTVTGTVAVFVQPLASVPVTVYVMDDAGTSVTVLPLAAIGAQLYVSAPVASSVTVLPAQSGSTSAKAFRAGNGFTVTVTVSVPIQPLMSVPVTVYVVVAAGPASGLFTVDDDNPLAGNHEYVFAPLAITFTGAPPSHNAGAAGANVITGFGLMTHATSLVVALSPLTVQVTTHT